MCCDMFVIFTMYLICYTDTKNNLDAQPNAGVRKYSQWKL